MTDEERRKIAVELATAEKKHLAACSKVDRAEDAVYYAKLERNKLELLVYDLRWKLKVVAHDTSR